MTISDKKMQKMQKMFECKVCYFRTVNKYNYNKHILTLKHKNLSNSDKIVTNSDNKMQKMQLDKTNIIFNFECDCGKKYKYRQGLSYHKSKCMFKDKENTTLIINEDNKEIIGLNEDNKEIIGLNEDKKDIIGLNEDKKEIIGLKEDNKELKNMVKELIKENAKHQLQISELIPKIGNNNIINNTQNNNQKFNINVFLNEQCKDALNMSDFIKSLHITIEQLDFTKQNGLSDGLSKSIIENMNKLSIYERPLHCTDVKRETLYIKEDDNWSKDGSKDKLKHVIKKASSKNYNALAEWKSQNPDFLNNEEKTDYFTKTISTIGKPTTTIDEKVIKSLCKETYVK